MSAPVSELPPGGGNSPHFDLIELMHQHEVRQTLAARAAYSLLRITAAVPQESRLVGEAVDAGQRTTAWLAGSSTNPGRWTSGSVLAAELADLDVLLVELQDQLATVLAWVSANVRSQARRDSASRTIRVPRTLLSECTTLIADLAAFKPGRQWPSRSMGSVA